jgi:DhnA family fructose-bisphosphate aldolase class Ia
MSGIASRLSSVLNKDSGRAVVVAFDHGTDGAVRGGEDAERMLTMLAASDAEGILLAPGLATHYAPDPTVRVPSLLVGIDLPIFGARPATGEPLTTVRDVTTPVDALRLGAVMCKMLLPLGWEDHREWGDAIERIALRAAECDALAVPLMVEPAFWGTDARKSDDEIVHAARVAVELGAHVLKVPATEDPARLAEIVEWSPVPVYVLGGDPEDSASFARRVVSWVDSGATGVVVGRNVWNRRNPAAAVDALREAVHGRDVAAATALLEQAGEPLGSL